MNLEKSETRNKSEVEVEGGVALPRRRVAHASIIQRRVVGARARKRERSYISVTLPQTSSDVLTGNTSITQARDYQRRRRSPLYMYVRVYSPSLCRSAPPRENPFSIPPLSLSMQTLARIVVLSRLQEERACLSFSPSRPFAERAATMRARTRSPVGTCINSPLTDDVISYRVLYILQRISAGQLRFAVLSYVSSVC